MKSYKNIILFIILFYVLISCSNLPTNAMKPLKLKDRAGRYSLKGNFDKDIKLDFIIYDTGNISFIGNKSGIANNLGTYFLGDPKSENKTFSFDIKETINGVAPNTYFIDFSYYILRYSGKEVNFQKVSDSTNMKFYERSGTYYNKNKNNKVIVYKNKIEWSYFPDAYIDIENPYTEETDFIRTVPFVNDKNEKHSFTVTFTFTDNSVKLKFNITDPAYSQYNKEEEYRIIWE